MVDTNRRKYPRADYPCQLTIWPSAGATETILANASNVSIGGLCVFLNHEITVGTQVDVELHFPNTAAPFRCRGLVVRCAQESEKFYNTGIQFENLDEIRYAFLNGIISEIIRTGKKGKK